MRHRTRAYLTGPDHWRALFGILAGLWLALWAVAASAGPSPFTREGKAIIITQADLAFSTAHAPPLTGWEPLALPQRTLTDETRKREAGSMVVWTRMRFDRADAGEGPLSLFTQDGRERITLYLNGVDIFRNHSAHGLRTLAWYRPYLISLPSQLLKERDNEILVRTDGGIGWNIAVGEYWIGPTQEVGARFAWSNATRSTGPRLANYAVLGLSFLIFLLWLARRRDAHLLWLSLLGLAWYVRNLHFYVERVPFDPDLFNSISSNLGYFVIALTFIFCAEFLQLERRGRIATGLILFGCLLAAGRSISIISGGTDFIANFAAVLIGLALLGIMFRAWLRTRAWDELFILLAILFSLIVTLHDLGRLPIAAWWDGVGFYFQPYLPLTIFAAFLYSIGRRFLRAVDAVEGMNTALERRVTEAMADLERSEAAQRALEIDNALEKERERLMREMHDGIGANLVTALAVAEQQNQPAGTIATLRRAIADLKITVDSLEPVEGDLLLLLANLRHRMEPDLRTAGLRFVWKAEPCPPLVWLDSSNALQVLRTIQEAIGNVLAHAHATEVGLACQPAMRDLAHGILVTVTDNGKGFAPRTDQGGGKGLSNMRSRISALHGEFSIGSAPGAGTRIEIWLPLIRRT